MTEDEMLKQVPIELQLNLHKIGRSEVARWVDYYKDNGVWPTTEQAYKSRYEIGEIRDMPFPYFRKFVLQDLNLSDFEKENLFLIKREL